MINLAGIMDRKVRLEKPKAGQQANGQPIKGFDEVCICWAGKKDESGNESEAGKQVVATGKTTWTIRYRDGVTPLMRLIDLTTQIIYGITEVAEVGRREALQLTATRINA